MVLCPYCGTEVTAPPIKSWEIPRERSILRHFYGTTPAAVPTLKVNLFACPKCGRKFRKIERKE